MSLLSFQVPPQRILIIKPSAIGDIVHALPVLNLLRRRWPEARVSWMVTPACAGLLQGHPQVDELIPFERQAYGKGWRHPGTLLSLFRFAREIRQRAFDLVIDLQGLFRSGWLVAQTQAPVRIGFANAREFGWIAYTHRVETSWSYHAVDRYLDLAEAMGLGREPVEFQFAVGEEDRKRVSEMVDREPYAVLLPGTNWATKRWPVERFAAIVEPIRQRLGLRCIVAGGPDDVALGQAIPGAINLAGKTNLRQLVALLERAALVIANDSGPMHIAAALGRPLVALYGPTSPQRHGPYGRMDSVLRLDIPCSPCYSRKCSHQSCLQWLTVEPVIEAAAKEIEGGW